jgi:hypothetical protein
MKKFEKNDLFYNTIVGNPSYKVVFYNGNVTINDQINEGNRITSSLTFLEKNFVYTASMDEGFTKNNYIYKDFDISGTLSYNPQIKRNFVYKKTYGAFEEKYTLYSTVKKISALKNIFSKYSLDNSSLKISEYLENDGIPTNLTYKGFNPGSYPPSSNNLSYIVAKKNINLIEIPQAFYGIKVQPGTLNLKIYITGTLIAEASDIYKNSKIIQTSSSYNASLVNTEIGSILYDEGIIILTGSSQLSNAIQYYIQPVSESASIFPGVNYSNVAENDYVRWIHFGSHKVTSTTTTTQITASSFELSFQGSTQVNALTMFCSADKNDFTWSNNRTYISGGQSNKLVLGQTSSITVGSTTYSAGTSSYFVPSNGYFFENDQLLIKNTVSSSFSNFSAPYQPQVYISEIGIYNEEGELIAIGKLANPLKKMADRDYTIKLKLEM